MRVASNERGAFVLWDGRCAHFLYERPKRLKRDSDKRAMTNKERELEQLLAPTVRALGCEIWGIEYRPRGRGRSMLKLYIDSADGVTIDDCERVSHQVSALLDVEDPIVDRYRLEVSSPGLDRVLFHREHYLANIGRRVDVRLTFPFGGRRHVEGQLAGIKGQDVIVYSESTNGQSTQPTSSAASGENDAVMEDEAKDEVVEYALPLEQIQRARIVPEFGSPASANRDAARLSVDAPTRQHADT